MAGVRNGMCSRTVHRAYDRQKNRVYIEVL
jgi:hypothetical protein